MNRSMQFVLDNSFSYLIRLAFRFQQVEMVEIQVEVRSLLRVKNSTKNVTCVGTKEMSWTKMNRQDVRKGDIRTLWNSKYISNNAAMSLFLLELVIKIIECPLKSSLCMRVTSLKGLR